MKRIRSKIDPAYLNHNTRVLADGGTPGNQFLGNRNVEILKRGGLFDKCIFFADAIDGKKVDSVLSVSKLYDLKGNADLAQGTASSQPIVNTDGSLTYNVDRLDSATLSVGNPIREATTKITCIAEINATSGASDYLFFDRYPSSGDNVFVMYLNATNQLRVGLFDSTGTSCKSFRVTGDLSGGRHTLAFTFDGDLLDETNGTNGRLLLYVDGVLQTPTKIANTNITALNNSSTGLVLGRTSLAGTKFGFSAMFNAVLTATELAYIHNNFNYNRLSSMYSPDTVAHINRTEAVGGIITDPNGVEFMYRKLEQYNLTSFCKLLSFADGGVTIASGVFVGDIFNLASASIANRGTAATTLKPSLTTSPYEKGKKVLRNQLATALSGIRFESAAMKGIFRNKTKGAIITIQRKITGGAISSSVYSGFTNDAAVFASRLASNEFYSGDANNAKSRSVARTLDADAACVSDSTQHDLTSSHSIVSYADWTNKALSTWNNGVVQDSAKNISASNAPTSDTDSYYVVMNFGAGTAGTGYVHGDSAFFSAFEGAFDINNVLLFEADVRKYYGIV